MSRPVVNPAYFQLIRLQVHELIAYPLNLIGSWINFPFAIFIFYIVYGQIYQINPTFGGISFGSLMAYLSIAVAFRKMAEALGESYDVQLEIKAGDIFAYLTRPINYFGVRLSRQTGKFVARAITIIPILYLLVYGFTGTWLSIPHYAMGITLALLGSLVIFQIYYIIGLLSFWFEEVWGFRRAIFSISYLLSGSMIPIALFPDALKTLSFLLPFQHQAAIPAQFVLQQVGIETYGQSLLILFVWFIILGIVQEKMWQKGLLKHDGKG
jgi:ABC-2 type transport system permease protein